MSWFMDNFDAVTTGIKVLVMVLMLLHVAPIMAWVERRGSALMQNRLGPNRVGPLGLLQSLADAVKFVTKEDSLPGHVEKFYFALAPIVSLVPSLMTFAVIPYASSITIDGKVLNFQVADLNVGLLYILAIASLGVYGIIMAGWASNNKYALLGSLRSSSQMISYELSMGLSLIGIIMIFGSVHLQDIATMQGERFGGFLSFLPKWGIFVQPLGFLIFLTAAFAETNRLPFDLPEGESEIIAGYHLEYGSMKFAIFMMAEFLNMTTACGMLTTLYFGGWHGLGWVPNLVAHYVDMAPMTHEWLRIACEMGAFLAKMTFFMWFFVWVRWTIPRFRYDQLMDLGWKVMLPLALANVLLTGGAIYLGWI